MNNDTAGPWSTLAFQIEAVRADLRSDIAATRKDLGDAIHRVEANVAMALDGYREQGLEMGRHMARCEQRHRRDTDEAKRSAAAETRLTVLEETGVARGNWRKQLVALISVGIAAVGAGCALASVLF
jgi:hypothetical protein